MCFRFPPRPVPGRSCRSTGTGNRDLCSCPLRSGFWVFLAYGYCGTAFAGDGKEYRTGQTGNLQGRVEVDLGSRSGKQQSSYFHEHGYTRLDIPKGHYPPPGECRIWYPDQPAGQQPPPGDCRKLRGKVPPGGWLITNSGDDPKHVHIHVYDERKPNTIKVTGEFEIGSGIFVRVVGGR
jgi:hypothetical protein